MNFRLRQICSLFVVAILLAACGGDPSSATTELRQSSSAYSNLLVATEGIVRLQRAGWSESVPIVAGTLLLPGDELAVEGSAHVLCAGPGLRVIAVPGGPACPDGDGWLRTVEDRFSSGQRGSPADVPYIIFPRNTIVLGTELTIRWHDTGATSYSVEIVTSGAETAWKQEGVLGSSLRLPPDVTAALREDENYLLIIHDETTWHSSSDDPAKGLGFSLAGAELQAELDTQREAILALAGLDETARQLALAIYYATIDTGTGRSLAGEALHLLDEVVQNEDTAAVQLWRGDMLREVKLPHEAASAYGLAIQRAELSGDRLSQAAATASLWELTGDTDRLNEAIALYEQMGEKEPAKALRDEAGLSDD